MSNAYPVKATPLARFRGRAGKASRHGEAGVQLCERPTVGHINLRGDPNSQDFLAAVSRAGGIGLDLPVEPNTVRRTGSLTALWLGPREWLLLTPSDDETSVARALRDSLGGLFTSLTEISAGQTIIGLWGDCADHVLAKGCSVDLHSRIFGPGSCVQTHLAKARVVIYRPDDLLSYDLIVHRSYAEYLFLWLEDAATEYGVTHPTA